MLDAPKVEADETYVGGKTHRPWRHGRFRNKPHDTVLGIVERGRGRLKLVHIADSKAAIIQPHLEKHISADVETVYTDGHVIYPFALKGKFPGKHKTIDHIKAYAIGDTHSNTIESAFSLFKRGLIGSYHQVSAKHLQRYCNEFSYRFNRRGEQDKLFVGTLKELLKREPLTYKALTASGISES